MELFPAIKPEIETLVEPEVTGTDLPAWVPTYTIALPFASFGNLIVMLGLSPTLTLLGRITSNE